MKNEGEKKNIIINYFEAQLPGVSAMPQPVGSGDDDGEDDVNNDDDVVDGKIILCWRGIKKERLGEPSTTSILWQEKDN